MNRRDFGAVSLGILAGAWTGRRLLAQEGPLSRGQEKRYEELSPFEIKNNLIEMAETSCKKRRAGGEMCRVLNAGRGNPNFVNTTARMAYAHLSLFAATAAGAYLRTADLGLRPEPKGLAKKLDSYLEKAGSDDGATFLKEAIQHAEERFRLDPDEFVFEIADNALGDFYPSPPRISVHTETIVNAYLSRVLCNNQPPPGKFDLFATEGATAAMIYVFKSLRENKILHPGDHIGIVTPIFSPYLEIPGLSDYQLVRIDVKGSEALGWQIPDSELDKLKDSRVKALFMVNPTNPTSVALQKSTIEKIASLIRTTRKDLIILTDTVYATFVDRFDSLVQEIPENTICVYSFSKYFGVTGWRLGVIMLHEDNVIDKLIAQLPEKNKAELAKRYEISSITPGKIKFIDRLELDSRDVALGHTGGLSGPQQCIMCLFCLFEMMDAEKKYKKSIRGILTKRIKNLYDPLGMDIPTGPDKTHYYALINLEELARAKHGDAFAKHLAKDFEPVDFLFRLAKQRGAVCLPGAGFEGPEWSLRVSLANLNDDDYIEIGKSISHIMQGYVDEWKPKKG
ncbi:MAG: bifunctional aspartate transaminase/aspartate 4-decarboxylase [Planctomycetes bacterium]|nr:bifunctional aspartate transaminase/aspartate 4-decarboxylase [Planctomycetota bacterium]